MRGTRGQNLPSPGEGTVGLKTGEVMDMSRDVFMSSGDEGGDDKAAVRLHVVVKEPPKLSQSDTNTERNKSKTTYAGKQLKHLPSAFRKRNLK